MTRFGRTLAATAAAALIGLSACSSSSSAPSTTAPPSGGGQHFATLPVSAPLPTDAECRSRVRPAPELRTGNAAFNQVIGHPTPAADGFALASRVTGDFTGTTDEIIQWAAYKHGISEDLLRAVAVQESWWHMSTVGDNGDSFGLFQIRRPYHCCPSFARNSTAFNADYYGAILRSYYDGKETWLNTVERGRDYKAGDLWGSVGAWFAGRWHTPPAEDYIKAVKGHLKARTWRTRDFRGG
jgi:hypothetical protein